MAISKNDATQIAHSLKTREIMAYIALGASIFGSMILTGFAIWVIWIVWQGGWALDTAPQRISILSKALVISLGGSLIVLITLGFVISRRTIKVTKDGFTMQSDGDGGGDDNDDDDDPSSRGRKGDDDSSSSSSSLVSQTTEVIEKA